VGVDPFELTVPSWVDDDVEAMRVMIDLVLLGEDFELERSFLKNILGQDNREQSGLRREG
jgi:hypothetical protein